LNVISEEQECFVMSIASRLLSWYLHFPPAETHNIVITRNIPIPMPDGTVLYADHYAPHRGPKRPTLLVRSSYGRKGFVRALMAMPYVERGYQVLLQGCRGTGGSEGKFAYVRNEREDGLATIAWIKQQPWFTGELALVGASYLGVVQWAVAAEVGPELKAIVPQITTSDFHHFRFQGGSFNLETSLDWSTVMTGKLIEKGGLAGLLAMQRQQRRLKKAYMHLPLGEADQVVIGEESEAYQNHIRYAEDDPRWAAVIFRDKLTEVAAPAYLMSGWYDLFLAPQLEDFQILQQAGKRPYLLIGPWVHGEPEGGAAAVREGLAWLHAHITDERSGLREKPVRLFIMGTKEWRDFAAWPPPAQPTAWYLQAQGGLAPVLPSVSEPDTYRYDPADPTPAVGGNSLGVAGAKDNRKLEARADVLVYTSAILQEDLEVIGPVKAELFVRSSLEHTDFFARLCVVEASGKSINLCDGILRLTPGKPAPQEDGSLRIDIELWPTAYHFRKGQRLRVQVSSGAHPRFARNLGTGEPLATGTKMQAANQTIYHDPAHPSRIILPVTTNA